MSYLRNSLAGDEVLRADFKQHWIVWVNTWALIAVTALFGAVTLWAVTRQAEDQGTNILVFLLPTAIFALWSLYSYLLIRSREFGLTDRRVIEKTGIIARNTSEIKLAAAETATIHQSMAARVMGFGNVTITGRGNSIVEMRNIRNALDAKKFIENEIRARKGLDQD